MINGLLLSFCCKLHRRGSFWCCLFVIMTVVRMCLGRHSSFDPYGTSNIINSKQFSHNFLSVCLTGEKVSTSHEGLPVDQAQGIHVHLLQCRLTVPQVHRPLQHLWSHVADCPHLVDGRRSVCDLGEGDEGLSDNRQGETGRKKGRRKNTR